MIRARVAAAASSAVLLVICASVSASASGRYVRDELLVEFVTSPTDVQIELFERRFLLEHLGEVLPPWHHFRILDGADAADKVEWVREDPLVCHATVVSLGGWGATSPDPTNRRCDGAVGTSAPTHTQEATNTSPPPIASGTPSNTPLTPPAPSATASPTDPATSHLPAENGLDAVALSSGGVAVALALLVVLLVAVRRRT